MEKEEQEEQEAKAQARAYIAVAGIALFWIIFCYGCRQLALLEDRINRQTRYEILEQELVELTDEGLDDLFSDDE